MEANQPIGIFDSGVGGLTVAHALINHLPNENIIYFGDTAHMPYGDKSSAAIQAYSVKIAHMLLQQNCKLILIACNSASTAAYDLVKEYVGSKALVANVIDPVVQFISKTYPNKHIGLIGTKQTVNSHIYKKKIDDLNKNITLHSQATNLLASAIEEFGNHEIIDALLKVYLKQPSLNNIDALILACTHYPIVKERISHACHQHTKVIDASDIVGLAVKATLEKHNLINPNGTGNRQFYISDYTESFATHAELFFGRQLTLEHYPIWD